MNKTVYVIKLIISIVIGVVGGYLLYNLVLMDMVPTILCDTIYVLSSILTMILSMVACTFIVYLRLYNKCWGKKNRAYEKNIKK